MSSFPKTCVHSTKNFTLKVHEKVALVSRFNNINRQKMGLRSGRNPLLIKTMLKMGKFQYKWP